MIPLSKPSITEADCAAVEAVLRSGRLSLGPIVEQFESELATVAGVKYAVCVNSGTSALELIVKALGIGPSDEVICPSFTFIASANCIVTAGATPVFVEIDATTYCLDPAQVEAAITPETRAILGVDLFGRCADWMQLHRIAKEYDLLLIEDACEAIGASHADRPAGSFGNAACFSFYPNKQITAGEGGVMLTNDSFVARYCLAMRNQGRVGSDWLAHQFIGHNYRMTEMQAALGLSQLVRLPALLDARKQVADAYTKHLQSSGLDIHLPLHHDGINWFVYVVQLGPSYTRQDRDHLIQSMADVGIECRAYFPPIHLQPAYRARFHTQLGQLPITEAAADRTIALPFYSQLCTNEIEQICQQFIRGLTHAA